MDRNYKVWIGLLAVISILVLLALTGCHNQREKNDGDLPTVRSEGGGTYAVTTIEGCQYIACYTHNGFWVVTHKGNCTNSIHVYRMENK
jgi:hypothetical protein